MLQLKAKPESLTLRLEDESDGYCKFLVITKTEVIFYLDHLDGIGDPGHAQRFEIQYPALCCSVREYGKWTRIKRSVWISSCLEISGQDIERGYRFFLTSEQRQTIWKFLGVTPTESVPTNFSWQPSLQVTDHIAIRLGRLCVEIWPDRYSINGSVTLHNLETEPNLGFIDSEWGFWIKPRRLGLGPTWLFLPCRVPTLIYLGRTHMLPVVSRIAEWAKIPVD